MTLNHLSIEKLDLGLLVISVQRPTALNALNLNTLRELREVLSEAAGDATVRVVILTGSGEKSFIAGADIAEMQEMDLRSAVEFSKLGSEVARLLEEMPKPTIAMVQGFALGGGCEMALACDFAIAADSAVFGQPEVGLGLIPGFGGTYRLLKRVGVARAKELIFSGRKMKADEAFQMGLVSQVVPHQALRQRTLELAEQISRNSLNAVVKAKELLNEFSESSGISVKSDAESHAFGRLFGTEDQKEGLSAFLEKRRPRFLNVSTKEV